MQKVGFQEARKQKRIINFKRVINFCLVNCKQQRSQDRVPVQVSFFELLSFNFLSHLFSFQERLVNNFKHLRCALKLLYILLSKCISQKQRLRKKFFTKTFSVINPILKVLYTYRILAMKFITGIEKDMYLKCKK